MSAAIDPAVWWQRLPACLAAGQDAVLVSVVRSQGSAPRDAGATMLVEAGSSTDTIGGGNLEFEAITAARALLAGSGAAQAILPYTLGPALRQCCGGAVWLLYERIEATAAQAAAWKRWSQGLLQGERLLRQWNAQAAGSQWRVLAGHERQHTRLVHTQVPPAGGPHWQQVIGAEGFPVRLFGAGHVGRALVQVLAQTDARLQWIDPRPEMAAGAGRFGALLRSTDEPLDAVHDAPAGTWFLVMTHSHTLDFELVEAILRRRDAAFCGLIGSATKAARFRHNLQRQGLDASAVAGLTCPIGIPGLHGKAPATVAIAVAAQLLQLREAVTAAAPVPQRSPLIARQS